MRAFKPLYFALACLMLVFAPVAGNSTPQEYTVENFLADFRNIPGVTIQEIAAIEALKKKYDSFTYGTMLCGEAFTMRGGSKDGFSVRFTQMLSSLFGIPFEHEFYDWTALITALENKSLDFSGELTPTEERKQRYFMTDPIYDRTIKIFTPRSSERLEEIATRRPLRFAVLEGTITGEQVQKVSPLPSTIVFVEDYTAAAEGLRTGEFDAFFEESPAVFYFTEYDFIKIEDFFPLIYSPVAMTTANPELTPIISVVQKFLKHGGLTYLNDLYNQGNRIFLTYTFDLILTDIERTFLAQEILSGKPVAIAAHTNTYPISFYNSEEKEFQGIAHDVLKAIGSITGLSFKPINPPNTSLAGVHDLMMTGKAQVLAGIPIMQRDTFPFLFVAEPFSRGNNSALLSIASRPSVQLNQILFSQVGVVKGSIHEKIYRSWFPEDKDLILFENPDLAFDALRKGEIDFLMGSRNLLMSQTNYREQPDFKAALVFDHDIPLTFAINPNEPLLHSIIEKAQQVVPLSQINDQWVKRVFDYRSKMLHDTIPYLVFFIGLLSLLLAGIIVVLIKNKKLSKGLEQQVLLRTQELVEKTLALEDRTATLQTIFSAIPDLVICRDLEGVITQCNDSLASYMNLRPVDIIGKTDKEIFATHLDDTTVYRRFDMAVIESGKVIAAEEYIYSPYLEEARLFEVVKAPLMQAGDVVGVMGIARDITERKAIEAAAQEASQAKGSFLARMSHEIRTPLNAIIGMTRIARSSIDNREKALYSLDQITTASTHLLGILNEVLDMSKIESGKFEVANLPFQLSDIIDEVSSIIAQRCKEKFINFTCDIATLPEFSLIGDKLRLNQVIINLLGNSIKFTKAKGTITFSVQVLNATEKDIRLAFICEDTGMGMSEGQLSKLFNAFEQADSSIAARFGGTGLGLAISQNLVNLMGGEIVATSEVGKGSRFHFELTFEKGASVDEKVYATIDNIDLSGKRILLAEDVEVNRIILNELLADTHVTIVEAEDGQKVVAEFAKAPAGYYQLIFMDIQMPNLDGYEATQKIRLLPHPDAKTIPIVAMTANAYQEDISMAMAVGMNGHISKPIDFEALQRTLVSLFPDCANRIPN